jgi:hypothetical protein
MLRNGIFQEETLLALTPVDGGYRTTFDIALDLADAEAGAADGMQGGPGPGGGPPPGGGNQGPGG